MSAEFPDASKISEPARHAFQDLKALGYDVEALGRRNMNDDQILELRDKLRARRKHARGEARKTDFVNRFRHLRIRMRAWT